MAHLTQNKETREIALYAPRNFPAFPQTARYQIDKAEEFIEVDLKKYPRRVWVIGNGPSLQVEDLDRLHQLGETCIAVNRIHKLYDQTKWRPNAWCFADFKRNPFWPEDLIYHASQGYPCYIKNTALARITMLYDNGETSWIDTEWGENIVPLVECFHDYLEARPPKGWHPPYICGFAGSMNVALQVAAVFEGMEEKLIILLGVDNSWQTRFKEDDDYNHFSGDYEPDKDMIDEPLTKRMIERTKGEAVMLHRIAAKEMIHRNGLIVNASRLTELEVHPKVSVDDLLDLLENE